MQHGIERHVLQRDSGTTRSIFRSYSTVGAAVSLLQLELSARFIKGKRSTEDACCQPAVSPMFRKLLNREGQVSYEIK
jgi:hypothetical protein